MAESLAGPAAPSRRALAFWVVLLAAGGVFAVTMGARQSLALFLNTINSTTGVGLAAVSLAFAIGQLAWGVTQPLAGHFEKAGVTPRRHLVELRTADAGEYTLGQELGADTFEADQVVDVTGTTKGKGFAGVMKRHGFKGVSASHGSHRNHRKPGSIGGASTPGRVFKGMRMAGRMGGVRQTTQNLTIHAVDAEKGLLLVKGAVPGPRGAVVLVRTAAKGA